MSTAQQFRPRSVLSSQYINGIYIPSALLIVGVAIVKKDWLPYAAVVALILGSWKVYNNRKSSLFYSGLPIVKMEADAVFMLGLKKCLKPDVYQQFNLKEKTILSHNVAM